MEKQGRIKDDLLEKDKFVLRRNEFHLEISPWNKIPQKTYMSRKMKQNFRGDTADRLFSYS